jgi:hypothetical protein
MKKIWSDRHLKRSILLCIHLCSCTAHEYDWNISLSVELFLPAKHIVLNHFIELFARHAQSLDHNMSAWPGEMRLTAKPVRLMSKCISAYVVKSDNIIYSSSHRSKSSFKMSNPTPHWHLHLLNTLYGVRRLRERHKRSYGQQWKSDSNRKPPECTTEIKIEHNDRKLRGVSILLQHVSGTGLRGMLEHRDESQLVVITQAFYLNSCLASKTNGPIILYPSHKN